MYAKNPVIKIIQISETSPVFDDGPHHDGVLIWSPDNKIIKAVIGPSIAGTESPLFCRFIRTDALKTNEHNALNLGYMRLASKYRKTLKNSLKC